MISLNNDKSYCKVIEWFPNYCQLEAGCHISNKAPYSNPIQPELSWKCDVITAHDKATKVIIECFHMTSRGPHQNNGGAAMLVSQTSPVGVELFSSANVFFGSNKFAQMLAT